MKRKSNAILRTVKVIYSSADALTIKQIAEQTQLCHRTIQRHAQQLVSENMVKFRQTGNHKEYEYYKAF